MGYIKVFGTTTKTTMVTIAQTNELKIILLKCIHTFWWTLCNKECTNYEDQSVTCTNFYVQGVGDRAMFPCILYKLTTDSNINVDMSRSNNNNNNILPTNCNFSNLLII